MKKKTHPLIDCIFTCIGCIDGTICEMTRMCCDLCCPDEEVVNSFVEGFNKGKQATDKIKSAKYYSPTTSPNTSPKSYSSRSKLKPTPKKR